MRSKDYEYGYHNDDYEITIKRREELLAKVKDQVRKGFIAHHQILAIGQNDDEYDYIYDWLDSNDIQIRGINGTLSGEIDNYTHIPKMGQSYIPDRLDEEEQQKLFLELSKFSDEDKENFIPEYERVRSKLIESSMALAKWVTSWKGISQLKIPQEDKQQMAMVGLINAVDKFNPNLGYKFSTYATKAIYRSIVREAFRQSESRHSIIAREQLAMIPDIQDEFNNRLGRDPEDYEIATILGVSVEKVCELQALRGLEDKESLEQREEDRQNIDNVANTLDDGDKIQQDEYYYMQEGVYIDEQDELPYGFTGQDMTAEQVTRNRLAETVNDVLDTLPERTAEVLRLRFGLMDGEPKSLEFVANHYDRTRERVRQIENKAIRMLRHPSRCKKIKDFYR